MPGLDADLATYYDQESVSGRRTGHAPYRSDLLQGFVRRVDAEGGREVVDIGAGPGLDTVGLRDAGLAVVGVDLSIENAGRMRAAGVPAIAASLYDLPFGDNRFDVLWTMSTFVHVPHTRSVEALTELLRVVRPGGLLGIGTWGGFEWEGISDRDDIEPRRFFSLTTHERWRRVLESVADVEEFTTLHPDPSNDWEYQFAVLRAP